MIPSKDVKPVACYFFLWEAPCSSKDNCCLSASLADHCFQVKPRLYCPEYAGPKLQEVSATTDQEDQQKR